MSEPVPQRWTKSSVFDVEPGHWKKQLPAKCLLVGPGGRMALHLAVRGGRADLVSLLVRHGADAGVRDDDGNTPLDIAAASHKDEIASLMQS